MVCGLFVTTGLDNDLVNVLWFRIRSRKNASGQSSSAFNIIEKIGFACNCYKNMTELSKKNLILNLVTMFISVVNRWHFGMDPEPWIRVTDLRIRIRITDFRRILLFPSVADKMLTKNSVFFKGFFSLLIFEGEFTSVFIDKNSKRSHKIVKIKVFLLFFACSWKDPDPEGPNTYGSGSTTLMLRPSLFPVSKF